MRRIPVLHTIRSRRRLLPRRTRVVLIAGLAIILWVLALRSPWLSIKEVIVVGTERLPVESVRRQSGVQEGALFWGISPIEVQRKLLEHREIAEARVERVWPGRLYIAMREEPIVASYATENGFVPLTGGGGWLPKRPDKPPGPLLEGPLDWSAVARQLASLPPAWRERVVAVRPSRFLAAVSLSLPPHEVEVRTEELANRLPSYAAFSRRPPGRLHLLDAIWFSPERKQPKE